MGGRKRRTFTREYKAEVVRLVRTSGKSIPQLAKALDLGWQESGLGSNRLRSTRSAIRTGQ